MTHRVSRVKWWGGGGSHGRVRLEMFENSGLVLRFFLLVHKPLVSKPLASKPLVSKPLASKPLVSRWIVGTRLAEQTLPPRSFKALRGIFGYGFQNRTPPTVSSSMSVFGFL